MLAVQNQIRRIKRQQPSPLEQAERLAVNKFLTRWCDVYQEVKHEPYVVKQQDKRVAKELLDKPKDELRKRLIERYLKCNEWYAKIGHPLHKFDWNAHSDEAWANRTKIVPLSEPKKRVSALAMMR
jgi:hypothetical protein